MLTPTALARSPLATVDDNRVGIADGEYNRPAAEAPTSPALFPFFLLGLVALGCMIQYGRNGVGRFLARRPIACVIGSYLVL